MTQREASLLTKLEEARDRAAAVRAEADRALQPTLEEVARLEAEAARLEAELAEKREAHQAEVREKYRRQGFAPGPFQQRFTEAIVAGDFAGAFAAYRDMRAERGRVRAADEQFQFGTRVGEEAPVLLRWLESAFQAAEYRDMDEAADAIRAELEATS